MDEQNRIPDLDALDVDVDNQHASVNPPQSPGPPDEGEPIQQRIRSAVSDVRRRLRDELNQNNPDVVQEYEQRYYGAPHRLEAPPPAGDSGGPSDYRPRRTPKVKRQFASVSDNERKWAALAHASTLLTALVGLAGGVPVLVTMLIPLAIYFAFRRESEYVAFHALQAFTIQLVGTVGFVALMITWILMWVLMVVVSAVLMVVIIGIFLLPLVILVGLVGILGLLVIPLGMVIYSVLAAVETWNGRNYRIPFVANWVEDQMYDSATA